MIRTDVFFADVERVIASFSEADAPRARVMLAELEKIAQELPHVAGACAVYRGRLHRQLGEEDAALAALNEALRLRPGNPEALLRRGDLQRDSGRYREALADYDQILAREPESLAALLHRAQAHQQVGNLRLAREDYQRALALEPRSKAIADRLKGLAEGRA